MSPVPTFPIFYRTPPVVTDYDCSTGAHPPYFKRMYLPQKTWQPHHVRKSKSPNSSVAEDAVYALRFDIATRHKYGFPIALATSNGCNRSIASMVEFGEDVVFEGLDKLVLRVQWPGYEHVDWQRPVRLTTPAGQITRGQLAEQIIDLLFAFLNRLSNEPVDPTRKCWLAGHIPGHWGMENIIMMGMYPVHENTFQVDIQLCYPYQAQEDPDGTSPVLPSEKLKNAK